MLRSYLSQVVFIILLSGPSYGFDFTSADALFARRENNLENISSARQIYQRALKSAQGEELLHAVEHLGKLAYYEGELLVAESDHSARRKIFQQCQDDVESINPAKTGKEYPAYFYWKSACIALWAKSAKPWSVPGRIGDLEDAMNRGLELDASYEGGGIHRIMGSVYLKSKALSWVPGLGRFYDPAKALSHIEKAIEMGPEYYNAHMVKAEILKELDRGNEGKKLLQEKANELSMRVGRNSLPLGLEPESKVLLKQMLALLENW